MFVFPRERCAGMEGCHTTPFCHYSNTLNSLALEDFQRPFLTHHVSSLSEQDPTGHLNAHSIKISTNNLSNYLNYIGNFILGSIQTASPPSSPLVPIHEKYVYLPYDLGFYKFSLHTPLILKLFSFLVCDAVNNFPCWEVHILIFFLILEKFPVSSNTGSNVCTAGSSGQTLKPVILCDLAQDAKSMLPTRPRSTSWEILPHKTAHWALLRLAGNICYTSVNSGL